MRYKLPYATRGQKIGLLGGSFDPAHEGHIHITKEAMKQFDLDQVWWLISPGNPLKKKKPEDILDREKGANSLLQNSYVTVTDLEFQLNTRYTYETILEVKRLYIGVSFVWLMGSDNLETFNLWKNWKVIVDEVPIGIINRPGKNYFTRKNIMTESCKAYKLPTFFRKLLAFQKPPAWCFISAPLNSTSSTQIRLSEKKNSLQN